MKKYYELNISDMNFMFSLIGVACPEIHDPSVINVPYSWRFSKICAYIPMEFARFFSLLFPFYFGKINLLLGE
jgi:hypothetical protein